MLNIVISPQSDSLLQNMVAFQGLYLFQQKKKLFQWDDFDFYFIGPNSYKPEKYKALNIYPVYTLKQNSEFHVSITTYSEIQTTLWYTVYFINNIIMH